jgi:hypothetical protein
MDKLEGRSRLATNTGGCFFRREKNDPATRKIENGGFSGGDDGNDSTRKESEHSADRLDTFSSCVPQKPETHNSRINVFPERAQP